MILNKTFFLTGLFVFGSFITSAQKINGLSFVASKDSIRTNDVSTVIDVNANYVALMPFGFIRDLSSPKFFLILKNNGLVNVSKALYNMQNNFKKEVSKL